MTAAIYTVHCRISNVLFTGLHTIINPNCIALILSKSDLIFIFWSLLYLFSHFKIIDCNTKTGALNMAGILSANYRYSILIQTFLLGSSAVHKNTSKLLKSFFLLPVFKLVFIDNYLHDFIVMRSDWYIYVDILT